MASETKFMNGDGNVSSDLPPGQQHAPRNSGGITSTPGLLQAHSNQPSDGEDDSHPATSSTTSPVSVASPPYWRSAHSHQRGPSTMSADSITPSGAITLRDNEASEDDGRNRACWARSVEIRDHTVVNGSATNIGAFVVWNIRVETLNVLHSVPCAT